MTELKEIFRVKLFLSRLLLDGRNEIGEKPMKLRKNYSKNDKQMEEGGIKREKVGRKN